MFESLFQNPDKTPTGHKLKRDCKIKWGSMVESLQSGIKIREFLQKFLRNSPLDLTDSEWDKMEEMAQILDPVKTVVEMICREDADLLMAEVAIKKLFKMLKDIGTDLAEQLLTHLKTEIGKRWQTDVAGLLKYLNDPVKNKPRVTEKSKRQRLDGKYNKI